MLIIPYYRFDRAESEKYVHESRKLWQEAQAHAEHKA